MVGNAAGLRPRGRRWFKRWQLSDVRRRLRLPVNVNEGRTLRSYAQILRARSRRPWPAASGVCKKLGLGSLGGDVRPHPVVAMGPDWHHPLKLAPSLRSFQTLMGRRHGIGSASVARWERRVPFATRAAPLANGAARDLFAAPSSTMRSHRHKTSFHTLGTKLGPKISLDSPVFLCSAKGPFLRPGRLHAKHRTERRSMIAQATATRHRRRH